MEKKRTLLWLGFLAGAATLAMIPEVFWEDELLARQSVNPTITPTKVSSASAVLDRPAESQTRPSALEALHPIPRANLFAAHTWRVAPATPDLPPLPAPPQLPAPALPVAPPVPFRFIGTVNDEDRLHIVLQRGQTIHVVGIGDVIDGTYRVEGLRGSEVLLLYLPMDLSQSVLVGSASGRTL